MQLFYRAGVDARGRPIFMLWAGHLPSRAVDLERVLMHIMRTLEAHVHGGDLDFYGFSIIGTPVMALGHTDVLSLALTTGGPDCADVYEERIHPEDPLKYEYDGRWRAVEVEETSIDGARGLLINITGGPDLTLHEVNEAASTVAEAAHEEANIIVGAVMDESLSEEVRVTVIATGFEDRRALAAPLGTVPSQATALGEIGRAHV